MANWRLLILAVSLASAASAQQQFQPFTCTGQPQTPAIVRTEGITELVGDLLLQCTGGAPTPAGMPIPKAKLTLTLNTAVTSRLVGNPFTDALLLMDEPQGSAHPNVPLMACETPGGCEMVGTGTGIAIYTGTFDRPNVFPAQQQTVNSLTWTGIPIDPPGSTGARLIRFTNLRANACQLGLSSTLIPTQIVGVVSVSNTPLLTINNPQQTLAYVQRGLTARLPQAFTEDTRLAQPQSPSHFFNVILQESFPSALKTRVSTDSSGTPVPQDVPGFAPVTESGFYSPALGGFLRTGGLADTGTKVRIGFFNIPGGAGLSVPGTVSITAADGTITGSALLVSPTPTAGLAPLQVVQGSATAIYEVVRTNSKTAQQISLDVHPSFPQFVTPGTMFVTGDLLPATNPQTTLFPSASLSYPMMCGLTTGIAGQRNDQIAALTFAPGGGSATLQAASGSPSSLSVNTYSGPLVPASFNYSLVSSGPAAGGVTATVSPAAPWLKVTLNQTTTPVTATLVVTPQPTGVYNTTVTFTATGAPGSPVSLPVKYTSAPGPWFINTEFTSAGSYLNNAATPGGVFVIFGHEFGPAALAGPQLGADGRAAQLVGDTRVLFDGVPAPLYYSAANQVAGFTPFGITGKATTNVQIEYKGAASPAVTIPVINAVPALFTADNSGGGQAAALNQNTSYNNSSTPESPGNYVVLYGTGGGDTTPAGRDGAFNGVGGTLPKFTLPVKVFIDGVEATDVAYAGPAPGLIEGVFQINARIPANARHNANLPVLVQVGDKLSQPGVTVAVK